MVPQLGIYFFGVCLVSIIGNQKWICPQQYWDGGCFISFLLQILLAAEQERALCLHKVLPAVLFVNIFVTLHEKKKNKLQLEGKGAVPISHQVNTLTIFFYLFHLRTAWKAAFHPSYVHILSLHFPNLFWLTFPVSAQSVPIYIHLISMGFIHLQIVRAPDSG